MRNYIFLLSLMPVLAIAQSTAPAATGAPTFVQKCSNQYNSTTGRTELTCTNDTSSPISAIKTQSNAMASGTGNMLGTGATTGEYNADLSTCDGEGNCTSAGTGTFSLDSIIGQGDSTGQSDVSEGVEAEITMHNTLDFTCGATRTHFLGSGIAVKISNCALDASKNVQSFQVSICRKMLQEGGCMRDELNSDSDSSNDVPPEGADDWSAPVTFTKTSMDFVNNHTVSLDSDASATGSCYSASDRCALDFTVNVSISGDLTELADQASGTNGNDELFMSGNNWAQRQADKPSWDAQFTDAGDGDFNAKSMMDCAENSLIGSADQGFLLSCDGTQQVNIASTTCNEVATCVQTETTVISYMTACESFVPISSQTCHVQMPYGSCEVFLESHEQTCDTITPHGTCVYELESVIQTCDIHIPNGSCSEELVMDDMACVYSVPEGSCNVELISSVETCTNTVPEGSCNVELDTLTKTCQENVSRTEECLITAETTESNCFAKPRYRIHECTSTKDIQEFNCSISYEAVIENTNNGDPGCSFPENGYEYLWIEGRAGSLYSETFCRENNSLIVQTFNQDSSESSTTSSYLFINNFSNAIEVAKSGTAYFNFKIYRPPSQPNGPYDEDSFESGQTIDLNKMTVQDTITGELECNATECTIWRIHPGFNSKLGLIKFPLEYAQSQETITVVKTDTCESQGFE